MKNRTDVSSVSISDLNYLLRQDIKKIERTTIEFQEERNISCRKSFLK